MCVTYNHCMQCSLLMDSSSEHLQLAVRGSQYQLYQPTGICLDSPNTMYITDEKNRQCSLVWQWTIDQVFQYTRMESCMQIYFISLGTGPLDVFWGFSPSFVPLVTKLKTICFVVTLCAYAQQCPGNCITVSHALSTCNAALQLCNANECRTPTYNCSAVQT